MLEYLRCELVKVLDDEQVQLTELDPGEKDDMV